MKALDVFKKIVDEKQAFVTRPTKGALGEYDIGESLPNRARPIRRKGWVLVDLFTASAVVQVHAALNPTNQAKFETMDLLRMVDVTWKLATR